MAKHHYSADSANNPPPLSFGDEPFREYPASACRLHVMPADRLHAASLPVQGLSHSEDVSLGTIICN
jgi:hypothetical protein